MMTNDIQCGKPYPLGATLENGGVNFAIFSQNTTKIVLCLYRDMDNLNNIIELELPMTSNHVHHGFVPGLLSGQLYGYRLFGPYQPTEGHRFNPHKLLMDPYAKAIVGQYKWNDACYGYNKQEDDLSFNKTDSAPFVPRSLVVDTSFNWEGDVLLNRPLVDSIIYELNVKGFSQLLPNIPENIKGKFAALSHPVALDYFKELGITTLELMPVQFYVSDPDLEGKGLRNYWGYNTLGFFAPHTNYASDGTMGNQLNEFKEMVKILHQHGIEVIMDVVYNHTGEGTQLGPTLSFRGIDNKNYYWFDKENPRIYTYFTGTGNTLDARQPWVLKLIMDSLRYWITDVHVDGFRFDLAPALARNEEEVNQLSSFFSIIYQDPVISRVKLIAEPWDVGNNGYQVGKFPNIWAEWNGKFRNSIRQYWNGEQIGFKTLILRLLGSPDLYKANGRTPAASINFITAHDGFTLHDLVAYKDKHNEKNGSDNTDGNDENNSKNYGTEGETDDGETRRLRKLHQKNLLTTLFISQGVPMLLAGDELGNSKGGNNNTYAQDNETSWMNWDKIDQHLLDFTRSLIKLRKDFKLLNLSEWSFANDAFESKSGSIGLFDKDGYELIISDEPDRCPAPFGMLLKKEGATLFIIFNQSNNLVKFCLPKLDLHFKWQKLIDTFVENFDEQKSGKQLFEGNKAFDVQAFSISIFNQQPIRFTSPSYQPMLH